METNFFKSILALQVVGDWKINIAKEDMDRLIVSVLFFNDTIGDDARRPAIELPLVSQLRGAFVWNSLLH